MPRTVGLTDTSARSTDAYHSTLRAITGESNEVLFETVERLVEDCRDRRPSSISRAELVTRSRAFVDRLERNAFVLSNRSGLLRVLDEEPKAALPV
jgi:hypothetical protein